MKPLFGNPRMNSPHAQAFRLLVLLVSAMLMPSAHADSPVARIKSAFIYNFAKFVEWPQSSLASADTLQLCSWGDSELKNNLGTLDGHEAQGHTIRVRHLSAVANWQGCHIVVIGAGDDTQQQLLLKALANTPILTISDNPSFTLQGGMVGLFIAANHVQFSVNLNAAQLSGLRLSARMLQLASARH